jgi:hypothetical protein
VVVSETSAGSPVVEMTAEEYAAYVEREVQRAAGLSAEEFRRAYLAGELDEADPAVSDLIGLLRIGQNGHASAA